MNTYYHEDGNIQLNYEKEYKIDTNIEDIVKNIEEKEEIVQKDL